jgi:hypothetical protein
MCCISYFEMCAESVKEAVEWKKNIEKGKEKAGEPE